MNLVLITQDFPPDVGGIHSYCDELGRKFAQKCSSFTVIAPEKPDAGKYDAELPYTVIRIPAPDTLLGLALIPRLPVLLEKMNTDVVMHAQWNTLIASAAARRAGYDGKIVCAAHGRELLLTPGLPLTGRFMNFYRKVMLQEPDLFLPVSRYTAGLLKELGVPESKIRIIPNGTDPESFHADESNRNEIQHFSEDDWVMLTTARLVRRKGVDVVLRAMAELLPDHQNLKYLVVGDGEELDDLKNMAVELGLNSSVVFTGKVPYRMLLQYYATANAFVMVPKTLVPDVEGFGIVYLEANACSLPVIGSTSGGVPDAIEHEKTGLLVPENNVEELKSAIERLIENPEEAKKMGEYGRERVISTYNWESISGRMLTEFEKLG